MKRLLFIIVLNILLTYSSVFAGVLLSEWTDATNRYCKYSDGTVLTLSFFSTCPSTN